MGFEWDELKRQSNLIKHEIDFIDAQAVFDGRPIVVSQSGQFGETRFIVTAENRRSISVGHLDDTTWKCQDHFSTESKP